MTCMVLAEPQLSGRPQPLSHQPLASQIPKRHPDEERVAAPGVAAGLIVAPPGQAKLDAIVVIEDAETMPDRAEAVGNGERIFLPAGEVDGSVGVVALTELDEDRVGPLVVVAARDVADGLT